MHFNRSLKYWFSFLLFIFSSCSQQLTPVIKPELGRLSLPFDTHTLLPETKLALIDQPSPMVEFITTPALEISTSFTSEEKYLVRAKTNKLFDKREDLLIDFGQISDQAFCFPLPNARVISPYGTRRGRNHTGMDLKTFANDTVRAAFDGIVRLAGKIQGYGNIIVLRHYNGLETIYAHNSKHLVKFGEEVKAGTPLALVGRTGRATTEHLHFETRINGQHFDPNLVIDFGAQKLHNNCLVFTPDPKGKIHINRL